MPIDPIAAKAAAADALAHFHEFASTIIQTVKIASESPDLAPDILAAIGAITGAASAQGSNMAANLTAAKSLLKIISDLSAARAQAQAAKVDA